MPVLLTTTIMSSQTKVAQPTASTEMCKCIECLTSRSPLLMRLTATMNPSANKKGQEQEGERKHGASRLRGGGAGKVRYVRVPLLRTTP